MILLISKSGVKYANVIFRLCEEADFAEICYLKARLQIGNGTKSNLKNRP